jgi:hypothetical protein
VIGQLRTLGKVCYRQQRLLFNRTGEDYVERCSLRNECYLSTLFSIWTRRAWTVGRPWLSVDGWLDQEFVVGRPDPDEWGFPLVERLDSHIDTPSDDTQGQITQLHGQRGRTRVCYSTIHVVSGR